MNDRELLVAAAKAAGYAVIGWDNALPDTPIVTGDRFGCGATVKWVWMPLADDGDALRLAVSLGISITPYPIYRSDARHAVVAKQRRSGDTLRELNPTETLEPYGDNPCAATRRAIVRAAAATVAKP